jgi:hypothetical protein
LFPFTPQRYEVFLRFANFGATFLSISFCSIMCLAEHLAIVDGRFAAFAPGRYVVGIHLFQLPDTMRVLIVTDCTIRTIADALSLRSRASRETHPAFFFATFLRNILVHAPCNSWL